jgi:chloramphenicol 3-O-phosphotransferase
MDAKSKKLILVNGTMGVGKTAACKELNKALSGSVWLDGDWCWMMNPFIASDYNKRMVEENIGFLLRSFLNNPSYEYVIFDWVIDREEIYDVILEQLRECSFELYKITLQCSESELRRRIAKDLLNGDRSEEGLRDSLSRQGLYDKIRSTKIDTSKMSAREVAEAIRVIVDGPGNRTRHGV